jgi:hypothetical protein
MDHLQGYITWIVANLATFADAATTIAAIVTIISLILLVNQVGAQRAERKNQAVAAVFDAVITNEFREKLRFIYRRDPDALTGDRLPDDDLAKVEEVTAQMDGLGIRMRNKIIPYDESLYIFWPLVLRCAQQLRPHLKNQRTNRHTKEDYKADFDWLARECKLYQLSLAPGGKIECTGNGLRMLNWKLRRWRIRSGDYGKMDLDKLLEQDPLPIFRMTSLENVTPTEAAQQAQAVLGTSERVC